MTRAAVVPVVVAEGVKTFGDEPVAYCWWLLAGAVDPELALEHLAERAIGTPLSEAYYGGPGARFAGRPSVYSTRTRTLVVQRVGMDV